MNSLFAILEAYDGSESDSESIADSGSWFCSKVEACNKIFSRRPPAWQVSFQGFNAQAYYSKTQKAVELMICSPGCPSFKLLFPTPLPPRTSLILPGESLVLEFTNSHEVSVLDFNQHHAEGQDDELNRIISILEQVKTLDSNQFCQMAGGVQDSGNEDVFFYWEANAAKCVETNEAIVKIAFFKTHLLFGKKLP